MNPTPFVSIVMPIRNEASFIEYSLKAVLAQDYTLGAMEVLIVDGMSTDETRAVVTRMAAAAPSVPVTILDNPALIVPAGLNIALAQARGEVIVRVDGHCIIAPDYVSRCVEHLQNGDLEGVGGPIETIGDTPLSQTIAIAMSSAFGVGGSAFRVMKDKAQLADTIPFPAYTRQAIERAGAYDEELVRNQDDEYNYRLRELGGKILLSPDIRSQYFSRSSIRSLWRQYYQYGYWKVRVMQKHPRQMRPRQFAPPLLVAALIGGGLLAPFNRWVRRLWLSIGVLYGIANLAATLLTAHRRGWKHLTSLPLIFGTLHLSYGLGFLVGLTKFARRWGETWRSS